MKIQDAIKKSSDLRPPTSVLRSPYSRAFTLMELLVVLAVIGLLMGLLLPALMGARERARITRARSEVQTLQQAWLAYWNTYGRWPGSVNVVRMDPDAVAILAGADTATAENPYRIAFMEFDEQQLVEGFKDPWRDNFYRIELTASADGDADAEVEWAFTTRVHCVNAARYKY